MSLLRFSKKKDYFAFVAYCHLFFFMTSQTQLRLGTYNFSRTKSDGRSNFASDVNLTLSSLLCRIHSLLPEEHGTSPDRWNRNKVWEQGNGVSAPHQSVLSVRSTPCGQRIHECRPLWRSVLLSRALPVYKRGFNAPNQPVWGKQEQLAPHRHPMRGVLTETSGCPAASTWHSHVAFAPMNWGARGCPCCRPWASCWQSSAGQVKLS